jgi:hypothetical protein
MSQFTLSKFLDSLTHFEVFEDSYDISLWSSLSLDEQTQAEDALIRASAQGDARALVTLGYLGVERAAETVQAQTQNSSPWVRFAAHRALSRLGGSSEGLIEDVISGDFTIRFGAVMELATTEGEGAEHILIQALEDPDGLVRSQALDSLIERYGLIPMTQDQAGHTLLESPLKTLNMRLMADLDPLWQQAAWDAKEIFRKLAAGIHPNDLGLIYIQTAPDNFRAKVRDAFFDEDQPFDTSLIATVRGCDRQCVETFLALQLDPTIRSSRAVEALASLNAKWVLPSLKVSATGLPDDHPYSTAVQNAIQILTSNQSSL